MKVKQSCLLSHTKQKDVFDHVLNVQIKIILQPCAISSGPLLSADIF